MTGADLRALRSSAGLTQVELAERVGIASTYLSRLENGKAPISKPVGLAALYVCFHSDDLPRRAAKMEMALRRIGETVKGSSSPAAWKIMNWVKEALA